METLEFIFGIIYENPIKILLLFALFFAIYGYIISSKAQLLKTKLEQDKFDYKEKKEFLETVNKNLGVTEEMTENEKRRDWFSSMVAEAEAIEADIIAKVLRAKKRPAVKAAKQFETEYKQKIRELKKENTKLRLEVNILDDYFPEYSELREHILDSGDALEEISEDGDKIDMVRKYISPNEYQSLSEAKRNQLALDNYLNKNHSKQEIGRFYERYLGYLWETEGWSVTFKGLVDGYEDLGRDLICKRNKDIEIIQAKNWASNKVIREKHVYQLYATKMHYCLENNLSEKQIKKVKAVIVTTTELSDMAKKVATYLKIEVKNIKLSKDYPMIKCNYNPMNKTKIYHLPFDQQYDKIKIGDQVGEKYALRVKDAEREGFRRAFRWKGTKP